ncbi:MAG: hypothetical protein A2Y73_01175 [Chloroflexi bacterium RBG_13_56_8]|nr:MAG: hypothetical protein A2Y73_01175 [Chloroflexi bacterium RBG_13_56_8]
MHLKALLEMGFQKAREKSFTSPSLQILHRARSREWVETLADGFRQYYQSDERVCVFSKHNDSLRKKFGLNELLYDIFVCRVGVVESARHKKELLYVREALWQIESEFARDSRQALVDFNKLVLGSARNKLFIGPQVSDPESFLGVLLPAACACAGSVHISLIPHPRDWDKGEYSINLWKLVSGRWEPLE